MKIEELITKNADQLNWGNIVNSVDFYHLDPSVCKEHEYMLDREIFSFSLRSDGFILNRKLSPKFVELFFDKLTNTSTINIFSYQPVPCYIIDEQCQNFTIDSWIFVVRNQQLNEEYIEKWLRQHPILYCLYPEIIENQKLSECFLIKHKNQFDQKHWKSICFYQKLSQSFIERMENYVDWFKIFAYQHLDDYFIQKWKHKLSSNQFYSLYKNGK